MRAFVGGWGVACVPGHLRGHAATPHAAAVLHIHPASRAPSPTPPVPPSPPPPPPFLSAIPARSYTHALTGLDLLTESDFTSILNIPITLGGSQSNFQAPGRKLQGTLPSNFTIASLINNVNSTGIILVPNNAGFARARAALSQDKLEGALLNQVGVLLSGCAWCCCGMLAFSLQVGVNCTMARLRLQRF